VFVMAVAYSKLYELIKNVKDEKEAEELCKIIEEFFEKQCKENVSKKFEEQKPVLKLELKEELRKELTTKEDLELIGEKILRYVDNKINQVIEKINQLDKKIDEGFYQLDKKVDTLKRDIIIIALIIILANYAPSIIGKILSFLK